MSEKPPDTWGDLMRAANVGDPRNGEPSYSALARAAGLGVETVRKAVLGIGVPQERTLRLIAGALGVHLDTIDRMVGRARDVHAPYEPPDVANLLTDQERVAVNRIIRLLAENRLTDADRGGALVRDRKTASDQTSDNYDLPVAADDSRLDPEVPQ